MYSLSRLFLVIGFLFIVLGALVYVGGRFGLSLGRLPGDFRIERNGGVLYIPLVSSLLLSVLLTVVLNVLLRIFRK